MQKTADGGKGCLDHNRSRSPVGSQKTMHNDRQTIEVRSHVRGVFLQHGASQEDPIEEAILIRDGFYCGRRFQCGELKAVWFVEEDQLKIYDQEGVVQKATVSLILQQPQQKAA